MPVKSNVAVPILAPPTGPNGPVPSVLLLDDDHIALEKRMLLSKPEPFLVADELCISNVTLRSSVTWKSRLKPSELFLLTSPPYVIWLKYSLPRPSRPISSEYITAPFSLIVTFLAL